MGLLQRVEASEPGQAHNQRPTGDPGGGNHRRDSSVDDTLEGLGETKNLLGIGEKSAEDGYNSLLRTLS